jgi:hypothetical protein
MQQRHRACVHEKAPFYYPSGLISLFDADYCPNSHGAIGGSKKEVVENLIIEPAKFVGHQSA